MRLLVLVVVFMIACSGDDLHVPGNGPGMWTQVLSLDEERFEAPAIAYAGNAYYLGGITDVCPDASAACTVDRVDVYDPQANTWTASPPLPAGAPRHHMALATVNDVIYVVGGFVGILGTAQTFTPIAETWAFDGTSWTQLADSPMARGACTAQQIGGKIYVAGGGITEPSALDMLTVFDPAANTWQILPPMPTAREHVASCVIDGQFVVIGGWLADRGVTPNVEAYDPVAGTWSTLAPLAAARGGLGAAIVDGTCYAIGGEEWAGPDPGTFADVQGLASLTDRWADFAPLSKARHGIGVTAVGGAIEVIGGGPVRGNSYTTEVDQFAP
jgi:N-acetylneuraminic acid mutarotase